MSNGSQLRLRQNAHAEVTAANLLERLDLERLEISNRLAADPKRRAALGQFFTPASVAHFMASMLQVPTPPKELCILDAGGAAVFSRPRPRLNSVPAEDQASHSLTRHGLGNRRAARQDLARTFEYCRTVCSAAGVRFTGELRQENFILAAADLVDDGGLFTPKEQRRFHIAIMNPPYCKLRSGSTERLRMSSVGSKPVTSTPPSSGSRLNSWKRVVSLWRLQRGAS